MSETPLGRLRAAIDDAASGASLGTLAELGRPIWSDPRVLATEAWSPELRGAGGLVAWGAPAPEALGPWLGSVRAGGVVACVVAVARPGPRGLLDRLALLPSRHVPSALEDVCTALFVAGAGSLRVFPVDPRRSVVAVVGTRRSP